MSLVRAVGRNTIIQFAAKLVGTALGLVTVGLIQRYLAPAGYGAYTTAMAYLGFFSVVADFGLYLMLIRELAKPGVNASQAIGNMLGLRWVSAFLILSLGTAAVWFMPYGAAVKMAVAVGMWSFVAVAASQLLVGVFQSKLLMGRVAGAELVGRVVLLIGTALVVRAGGGLNQLMIVVVGGSLVNLLIVWLAAQRLVRFRPLFDLAYWRRILRDTWPVAISIVLNLIYFRIDTIFLSLFSTAYEVGLYGAAYKILEILNTFPIMFVGLLLPALGSAFAANQPEQFQRIFQRGFDLLLMAALPLLVGGWILAEPILVAIGQQAYAPAAPILRLLLVAVMALFLNSLSGHVVTIINRQRQMVWGYLTVAIIGLALYLVLIPRLAAIGAAIGTIVTESLTAIIGYILVMRVMRFRLQTGYWPRTVLATAVMGGVAWLLREQSLWLALSAAVLSYGLLLLASGALTVDTIRQIVSGRSTSPPTLPTA